MSEHPARTVGGLAPPPLSRLVKANRPTSTAPAPPTPAPMPPVEEAPPTATSAKQSITVYIPVDLRRRSRAVFNATRSLEGDESYSDMVAKAIEAELVRRETTHNAGSRYDGGDQPLPTGRPFRP